MVTATHYLQNYLKFQSKIVYNLYLYNHNNDKQFMRRFTELK